MPSDGRSLKKEDEFWVWLFVEDYYNGGAISSPSSQAISASFCDFFFYLRLCFGILTGNLRTGNRFIYFNVEPNTIESNRQ